MERSRAALVTGCSSGIGRATALALVEAGVPTWASARRLESILELAERGCRVVELDVTDEHARRQAVEEVCRVHGAVGILVNNAGYGEVGALEEISDQRLRDQFETNVFAVAALCRLVLPGMRAQGGGAIVNVGSLFGQVSLPGQGAYCMSKFAVEAFTEALRLEVRPAGVRVSLVAPQQVRTNFVGSGRPLPEVHEGSPYADLMRRIHSGADLIFRSLPIGALEPEDVAQVIVRAATADRPCARYPVGLISRVLPTVWRLGPERLRDALVSRMMNLS